ncbi:MAG: rhodanese-like domain-containing protein [Candidatus Izemoplasmatales bacterium]
MKKIFAIFTIAFLAIGFIGCEKTTTVDTTPVAAPETITMETVDDYLFNSDYQFVDLRNFDDQMADGWIRGFEFIPFFDYLEYSDILVRVDGWSFTEDAIKSSSSLKALFDEDKYIVLMCASGTRAGFVKDALDSLGYEHVYNAGGLGTYAGENKVFGDGEYDIVMQHPAMINSLPEEINMSDEFIDYYAARTDVQFVDLRNLTDTLTGWHKDSTVIPFFTFLETENILVRTDGDWVFAEEDIMNEEALRTLFCEDQNILLFCKSGTRAGYVKAALDFLGYENVWNVGGYDSYAGSTEDAGGGGCS